MSNLILGPSLARDGCIVREIFCEYGSICAPMALLSIWYRCASTVLVLRFVLVLRSGRTFTDLGLTSSLEGSHVTSLLWHEEGRHSICISPHISHALQIAA